VNDISSVGGGVDPRRGAGEVDGREADRSLVWIVMHAWWIGLAVAAALSVPLTASWIAYPTVVANARGIDYWPLGYVPMLLAPIVAWIGRDRTQSEVEVGRP
jgi:hypothetical protein